MFNKEKKSTFVSEVTGKRYCLELNGYADRIEMRVTEGRVYIELALPAIGINSFQDETVQALLYAIRQAVIDAETKVVGSNGNK